MSVEDNVNLTICGIIMIIKISH